MGHVWEVTLPAGVRPEAGVVVVSTRQADAGVEYRVVGATPGGLDRPRAVSPTLEDGYLWLMQAP